MPQSELQRILFHRTRGKMGTEKGKWDLGGFAPPKKNDTNSRYWPLGWKPGQLNTVEKTPGKVNELLTTEKAGNKKKK